MKLSFERYPTCFWHIDCPAQHHSGFIRVKRQPLSEGFDLAECLNCGVVGKFPQFSTPGCHELEEMDQEGPEG